MCLYFFGTLCIYNIVHAKLMWADNIEYSSVLASACE